MFGNLNAAALEPMGQIAGIASAISGSIMTTMSAIIGTITGQQFDGTVVPLLIGFVIMGLFGATVMIWVERGRKSSG